MKKNLTQILVLMLILGIFITSILYLNILFKKNIDNERNKVIENADNISAILNSLNDYEEISSSLDKLNDEFSNYYYISSNGKILHENYNQSNYVSLNEKNIEDIKSGEKSLFVNYSELGRNYFIESRILKNGDYFVISKLSDNPFTILKESFPGLLVIVGIGFFFALFFSERVVDDLVRVVGEQTKDFTTISSELTTKYRELYPLVRIINDQKQDIERHLKQMEEQAETINAIISNMKEGMILLDRNMNILAINSAAIKLSDINYENVDFIGLDFSNLLRNNDFINALNTVKKEPNKNYSFYIDINNKILNMLVSPVMSNVENVGFVMFIVDETKQKLLEMQRSEFSANVSHELKTPLTSINGYAEMIKTGIVKSEDIQKFGEIIYNEGQHLLRMIDDIIKISKLDEGIETLESEKIDIVQLIQEILTSLEHKIRNNNINVEFNYEGEWVHSYNRQILRELLLNLIDNGIKYNKIGGNIIINLNKDYHNKEIKIDIKDTGIGISEEDQERIFERFYTVDKSHNKRESSGLGLSIVKHIVRLLDGRVQLTSKLGIGSEFEIILPMK